MYKITLAEIAARSRQLSDSGQSDCPVMEERDKVRGWHPLLIDKIETAPQVIVGTPG